MCVGTALVNRAHAHDPTHSPEYRDPAFAQWFQSLIRPDGMGYCCSQKDCDVAEYEIRDGAYWVRNEFTSGQFLPVDPRFILERYDNPTGKIVICVIGGQVRCLVRASGT
jgi:hypothetical protein